MGGSGTGDADDVADDDPVGEAWAPVSPGLDSNRSRTTPGVIPSAVTRLDRSLRAPEAACAVSCEIPYSERIDMDRLYYTPHEVAEILAISDDSVLRLIRKGDLPAFRVSPRIIRVPIIAFDRWREGFRPQRRRVVHVDVADDHRIGAHERLPRPVTTTR